MSKSIWLALLTALVPIVGLTSCSKDHEHRETVTAPPRTSAPASAPEAAPGRERNSPGESPAAPPPKKPRVFSAPTINHKGAKYELKAWHQMTDRSLGLGETTNVGSPAPAITEITSDCGGSDPQTFTFEDLEEVPVFKLLPDTFLARDLKTNPVTCHFVVQMGDNLINRNAHEIRTPINDDGGGIEITGPQIPVRHGFPELRPTTLLGHRVGLAVQGRAEAQLVCSDVTFANVDFPGDLDLADFRTDAFTPRRAVDLAKFKIERPDQLCRVVIADREKKIRIDVTKLFSLRFNERKWSTTMVADKGMRQGTMHQGEEYRLAEYTVTNLEDEPIRLRFDRQSYRAAVAVNLKDIENGVSTVTDKLWIYIYRQTPTGESQLGHDEAFDLPPRETRKFSVRFRVEGDIHCIHTRVRMKSLDELSLVELRGSTPVGSQLLERPDYITKIQFRPEYQFDESKATAASGCYW